MPADIQIEYIAKTARRLGQAEGQENRRVYHDSPYGKEPIPVCRSWPSSTASSSKLLPVTHPGVEQKATWLQIRQSRPDYVLLWGWGVMNSTAIKEAAAVAYPRDKMLGVWWAGAEADTVPAEDAAKGYKALALNPAGTRLPGARRHLQERSTTRTWASPTAKNVGNVLYNRGMINAMVRGRGDSHRPGEVRQEAADRRAGALGHREPRPHRPTSCASSASRA